MAALKFVLVLLASLAALASAVDERLLQQQMRSFSGGFTQPGQTNGISNGLRNQGGLFGDRMDAQYGRQQDQRGFIGQTMGALFGRNPDGSGMAPTSQLDQFLPAGNGNFQNPYLDQQSRFQDQSLGRRNGYLQQGDANGRQGAWESSQDWLPQQLQQQQQSAGSMLPNFGQSFRQMGARLRDSLGRGMGASGGNQQFSGSN